MDFGLIVIYLIFFIIVIFAVMYPLYKEKQKKKKEEEEIQKRKEYNKQKQKDMQRIINFANKNGFTYIKEMLDERENKYSLAFNSAITALMTRPIAPTYTRGVKEGSLADNVAYLANVQKKKDYENQLSYSTGKINIANSNASEVYRIETQIIKKLKEIPDSKKYVSLLQNYFNDSRNELKKISR